MFYPESGGDRKIEGLSDASFVGGKREVDHGFFCSQPARCAGSTYYCRHTAKVGFSLESGTLICGISPRDHTDTRICAQDAGCLRWLQIIEKEMPVLWQKVGYGLGLEVIEDVRLVDVAWIHTLNHLRLHRSHSITLSGSHFG